MISYSRMGEAMGEESGRVYIVQKNNVITLETVITS